MSEAIVTGLYAAGDEEKAGKTLAAPIEVGARRSKADTSRRTCICLLATVVVILLLFPVVTIPILFTLYARQKNSQTSNQGTTAAALFSTTISSAVTPLVGGVSMTTSGNVQSGGGTSIYRNIGAIPADICPEYLSGTAIFEDKFLVSFMDKGTTAGSLSVMQVDSSMKASILSTTQSIYDLYHVATLNKATGLFVSISQAASNPSGAILAGSVDSKFAVKFGARAVYSPDGYYSFDPSLTALSNTTFAVAYYTGGNVTAFTRFGTVNPTTLAVTLSAPLLFGDNSGYGLSFAITGVSATQYMLVYCTQPYTATIAPLYAVLVTATTSTGKPILLTQATAFSGFFVIGTFSLTALDSGDVVVAYLDGHTNSGVTCTLIAVNLNTGALLLGSQLSITVGASAVAYSKISLVTIGTGSQFMVMFFDLMVGKAAIGAIVQSTKSALVRVSPNYVLSAAIASASSGMSFLSLAVSTATPHHSRVAIMTSITDAKCTSVPVTDFSFMEILPKPVGVMTSSGVSPLAQTVSVTLSGLASGFSGLVVGETYYTTTRGQVVTDGSYYGSGDTTASNTGLNGFFYANDITDNILVSTDSILGMAVASDTILLKTV